MKNAIGQQKTYYNWYFIMENKLIENNIKEYVLEFDDGRIGTFDTQLGVGRLFQSSNELIELNINKDEEVINQIINKGKLKPLA